MPLAPWQETELTGGGDTLQHFHLADRGPFPIPHGSFYDTTQQNIASTTTAYAMKFNTTVMSRGIAIVDTTKITVSGPGIYNIQFSAQLENSDSQHHDAEIWFAKNGSNITESSTIIGVPQKHGGGNGHIVAAWNLFVNMARNDFVQIMWQAASTQIYLSYRAATTSPTRPSVPSTILTVNLVSI